MSGSSGVDAPGQNDRLENGMASPGEKQLHDGRVKYSWRKWIEERFNWSWFTCTQSTGGIAVCLSECPKQFDGLQTIGAIVFIFNIVLFLAFTALTILRWTLNPSKIKQSFIHPPECFFYGSFWLSAATIIICMDRFGVSHAGPWLVVAIRVCFWMYAAITLLSSTIHLVVVAKYTPIVAIQMNPAWFLLIFNAMLTGTIAAAIAENQPQEQRLPITVAGIGYQGLGWLGSLLFLAWFIAKLLENGWPPHSLRPGLFMTVGAVGFTIVALIGAASSAPTSYGYFATHPTAHEVLLIVATWASIFLWVFALWLFALAFFITIAGVVNKDEGRWRLPMRFNNTWWGKYAVEYCASNLANYDMQHLSSPM